MRRFTSGVIAGGLIGALGLGYALSDRKTRKRMVKDGKKALDKASDAVNNIW